MSEKRLASSGDSFVGLTEMQIGDLLNKLSDENTRLHKKVDEQQATIRKLQDLCGQSDGENAKLRIENKEQQATITAQKKGLDEYMDNIIALSKENEQLRQERDYWKSKAMTLLMQVRRLTSRMTDKEVKEFSKELEE